ncbi:MAG TPA: FkbM family methyltransferase [Stellaceae bacterium]|nr:FkbM family methyltransferase [Stellaceae bacterium]
MDKNLASFNYDGRTFTFIVNDPSDVIQQHFLLGEFYEQRELEVLRLCIPKGAVVVDVGTNVGNHAIYFDRIMQCSSVVCFEPNPTAIDLLRANVSLNQAAAVDLTHLGVGLGRGGGRAKLLFPQSHNIGAARLDTSEDANATIVVDTMDNRIVDLANLDFIKIDAEGMELDVLAGAVNIISSYRPTLLVEVEYRHRRAFADWCDLNHYRIEHTFQRYQGVYNYLCVAKY